MTATRTSAIRAATIRRIMHLCKQHRISDENRRLIMSAQTEKPSLKEYTEDEGQDLIALLESRDGRSIKKVYPAASQLRALTWAQVECAVRYADLDVHKPDANGVKTESLAIVTDDGAILRGTELRAWCLERWQAGKNGTLAGTSAQGGLPPTVFSLLFTAWINPTSNAFLEEGGYKTHTVNPGRCFYQSLSRAEVEYLIVRFRRILEEAHQRGAS